MAFNGTGTFNRIYNWTTDQANGINCEADRMDEEFDGIATALSNLIAKDGQTTITANIPFNSKKITGLANGSARTDSIALGQVQDGTYKTLGTLGGSADTYTATPSPAITAYTTGSEFNLKVNADNTGASTLNVSAVDPKDIKKYDGAGAVVDLEAGDLQQDQYYKVIYDGTQFVVLNPQAPYISTTNMEITATTSATGTVLLPDLITISNGTDTDHDIDFTAGNFTFDDGTGQAVATTLTKKLDAAWVAGNDQGGLDTGSIAVDTTYYLFAIYNPTSTISDYLFSTSSSSPTMPSGYTKKKRIASLLTDGSSNIRNGSYTFSPDGSYDFFYTQSINDVSLSNPSTGVNSYDITVPLVDKIGVYGLGSANTGTTGSDVLTVNFGSPDEDLGVNAGGDQADLTSVGDANRKAKNNRYFTTSTAQIKVNIISSASARNFQFKVYGFKDYL